jgi:hypothetical protein
MPAHHRFNRGPITVGAVAAAVAALTVVTAVLAVSGGGYSYQRQGCSATADRNDRPTRTEPGCHNATLQLSIGRWRAASVNTDQTGNNTIVHSGSVAVDDGRGTRRTLAVDSGQGGAGTAAQDMIAWLSGGGRGAPPALIGAPRAGVTTGPGGRGPDVQHPTASIYLGADDNLDAGEHDGVNPTGHGGRDRAVANGPSDGGALQVNLHPRGAATTPASLTQNVQPTSAHDPLRAADAGAGACADGACAGADTTRRRLYQGGCRTCHDQAVYDDQHTTDWRSPDCNAGSTANQDRCGRGGTSGSIAGPYYERGGYYSDPGVFVYEDPDPQSSPALPVYPICGLYAGTNGIYVCSSRVIPAPATVAATPHRLPSTASASAPAGAAAAAALGPATALVRR